MAWDDARRPPAFLECNHCKACRKRTGSGYPAAAPLNRFVKAPLFLLAIPVIVPLLFIVGLVLFHPIKFLQSLEILEWIPDAFRLMAWGNIDHGYYERLARREQGGQ